MSSQQCSDELRLTLRRQSILVASFALITGVLVPVVSRMGSSGIVNPTLMLLLLTPWVLGMLVLVFDRRGPVKYWAAPLLVSLIAPALIICLNWRVVQTWIVYRTIPGVIPTLVVNFCLIAAFMRFLTRMSPRRCPKCGRWTLIPLRSFRGVEARTANTRWCGSCGAKYWRTDKGEDWKVERRRTWIDDLTKDSDGREAEEKEAKGSQESSERAPQVNDPPRPEEEPSQLSPRC
jgi:hypothetical protein